MATVSTGLMGNIDWLGALHFVASFHRNYRQINIQRVLNRGVRNNFNIPNWYQVTVDWHWFYTTSLYSGPVCITPKALGCRPEKYQIHFRIWRGAKPSEYLRCTFLETYANKIQNINFLLKELLDREGWESTNIKMGTPTLHLNESTFGSCCLSCMC